MSDSPARLNLPGLNGHDAQQMLSGILEACYPEKFKGYLSCPFQKHDPSRYSDLRVSCHGTGDGKGQAGYGFKELKDVVTHINRVHYPVDKRGKAASTGGSSTNGADKLRPEIMTEDQVQRWSNFKDTHQLKKKMSENGVSCLSSGDKWQFMIYLALWPNTKTDEIPKPFHCPGSLFPVQEIPGLFGKWLDQLIQQGHVCLPTINIGSTVGFQHGPNATGNAGFRYAVRKGIDSGVSVDGHDTEIPDQNQTGGMHHQPFSPHFEDSANYQLSNNSLFHLNQGMQSNTGFPYSTEPLIHSDLSAAHSYDYERDESLLRVGAWT